jgi:hypothetical protein
MKKFFSIVIDKLPNNEGQWDNAKKFVEGITGQKMADTITINFEELTKEEWAEVQVYLAFFTYLWHQKRITKQSKNN